MPAAPEPTADRDLALRRHLRWLLTGGYAHVDLATLAARLEPGDWHRRPDPLPHTAFELIEHLSRCQHDLLHHGRDPQHVSPDFPDGYWPAEPGDPAATLAAIDRDRRAWLTLVDDTDPLAPLPHAPELTLMRGVLVLADHDAYHLGQLALVARALGR